MPRDKRNEKLDLKIGQEQIVHMKVSAQIIQHLSKGIYSNPANAIKELINNSFDADAGRVLIRARPKFDTFSITDNGEGMDFEDFNNNFLWISRSSKRDKRKLSKKFKRPLIGKIGIGFVAVSQICDKMTVISSKAGQPHKFKAIIDFSKFKKEEHVKKGFYELSEVKLINQRESEKEHYTMVILSHLTKDFKELLLDKDSKDLGIDNLRDFEGMSYEKIIAEILSKKLDISKDIGNYWQCVIEIANIIPVTYLSKWSEKIRGNIIDSIKKQVDNLKFQVDFDGLFLKKPIMLPNEDDIKIIGKDFDVYVFSKIFKDFVDGSTLKFRGYIFNQKRMIKPSYLHGLIIRVKNTSIGGPDKDFLDYPFPEKLFLPWTFGEIYIEEGLEDAMNINRNSFMIAHPHYRKLKQYTHNLLHKTIFTNCRNRYTERHKEAIKAENKERETKIKTQLRSIFGHDFKLQISEEKSDNPIELNVKSSKLKIYTSHPVIKKFKKRNRLLVENILIAFESAYQKCENDAEKLKQQFLENLKELYYA